MPIHFAPPCDTCGSLYVEGSPTTCDRCERLRSMQRRLPHRPQRRPRLSCACGRRASTVILVKVGTTDEERSEERLALCKRCLREEEATVDLLETLGLGRMP